MADLVVVGGGAVGLAVAWRAAREGATVTLLDPAPGRGASWAAAGMLAPVTEVHYGEEALLELNLLSARRWPSFAVELAEESGLDAGYAHCGTVMVARDADDNAELDDVFAFQRELGLAATRLRSSECRALEPGLAPSVRGGILVEDDHQVDNRAFVDALLEACRRADVQLVPDAAEEIVTAKGAVTAVRTRAGGIPAETVVLATGSRTASIGGLPPEAVVVRPVKGQLVHLRSASGARFTEHNVRGRDVYVVSRPDGRVVVGATVEEMGFDTSVTSGGVHYLLDEARRLLPGVDELQFVEAVAGSRPGTPDNAPLLGRTSIEGLVMATGHYRNGILLAPATADAIVALVRGDEPAAEITAFDPARFSAVAAS